VWLFLEEKATLRQQLRDTATVEPLWYSNQHPVLYGRS
jgi:hypothetical protein